MLEEKESIIPHLGLLVLDVQEPFLKVIPKQDLFVNRVAFAVKSARLLGIPTLFTEQRPDVLGPTVEGLTEFSPHSPTVPKSAFSAFGEEEVSSWIDKNSIYHLLVAGLETPICVYQTTLDAINQDLEVTLLSDALGARRTEDAAAVLASLRIHGAHVLPSETIFYSILKDSKHPQFKEFTALVKKYSDS
jgi:nicotinamidase-related amidase